MNTVSTGPILSLDDTLLQDKYANILSCYTAALFPYRDAKMIYLGEGENAFVVNIVGSNASYVAKFPFRSTDIKKITEERTKHITFYEKMDGGGDVCIIPKVYTPDQNLLIMDKIEGKTLFSHWFEKKYGPTEGSDYEKFWQKRESLGNKNGAKFFETVHMSREYSLTVKELTKTQNALNSLFIDIFGPQEGKQYVQKFMSVLEKMKEKGIRHNDLHMRNIIITPSGKLGIIDFGMATFNT